MKRIYGTYRHKWTNKGVRYTPSYFLDKQFEDYLEAGLTKIKDNEIPEDRYTAELAPGIKKQSRFIIGEYNEQYIDENEFIYSIQNVGAEFNIRIFDRIDEAVKWVKNNTDLKEIETKTDDNGFYTYGKFEIYPERQDELTGETIPAKYLVID